jgi:hypothetical protein
MQTDMHIANNIGTILEVNGGTQSSKGCNVFENSSSAQIQNDDFSSAMMSRGGPVGVGQSSIFKEIGGNILVPQRSLEGNMMVGSIVQKMIDKQNFERSTFNMKE